LVDEALHEVSGGDSWIQDVLNGYVHREEVDKRGLDIDKAL